MKPYDFTRTECEEIISAGKVLTYEAQKRMLEYIDSKRLLLTNLEVVLMNSEDWHSLLMEFGIEKEIKITRTLLQEANIRATVVAALDHVGKANYHHREVQAREAVYKSFETGQYVDPDDIDAVAVEA